MLWERQICPRNGWGRSLFQLSRSPQSCHRYLVDVNGWLEAFSAHPQIGESPSQTHKSPTSAQWSKGEQSTALATATDSTLQELHEWNARYRQKFGFVFLIFASGRSTPEILAELKSRYHNRPIVEFELAAKEQMKIVELRLSKLFSANATAASATNTQYSADVAKAGGYSVSSSLFPFFVFSFCWFMFFLVCVRVFEFSDTSILDYEEL